MAFVALEPVARPTQEPVPFDVNVVGGRTISVWPRFDAAELVRLVRVLEEVDRRNRDLVAALQAFHEAFEAERRDRVVREQRILDRLGAAEHEAIAVWDSERLQREQVYMAVKRRLEEAVEARTKLDDRVQSSVFAEIAALKHGLQAEARARGQEDDSLAATLNAYVAKLQASLALINSEDADFA